MTTFQKGLVAGAGIILVLALIAGAVLGVWWLNSGPPKSITALNPPAAPEASTPQSSAPGNSTGSTPNASPPLRSVAVTPIVRPAAQAASFGLVRDVETGQLVVDVGIETETILLNDRTVIVYAGNPGATIEDIRPGDKLLAFGGTKDNLTDARLLIVAPASYTNANIVAGQITSVKGTTLVVTTRQGTRTVTTTNDTRSFDPQMRAGRAVNYPVGAEVIAIGQATTGGLVAEVLFTSGGQVNNNATPPRPPLTPTPGK